MLTPAEFRSLLIAVGEPVTVNRARAAGVSVSVKAIIQDMGKAPEAVVNAYGLTGRSVQIAVGDLAFTLEKFDQVTRANGERLTLDIVNTELARGSGAPSYYVAYAKGAA